MPRLNSNHLARTTLSSNVTSTTATTIEVTDGSVFPDAPFRIVVSDGPPAPDNSGEVMEVSDVTTNTLTVSRGLEGTIAATHSTGDYVGNYFTSGTYDELISDDDSRLTDDRDPTLHNLGGAKHGADTLANLNSKVSDATLDDSGDSRDPNTHSNTAHNPNFAEEGIREDATEALVVETRTTDPTSPATGRIWLRTDL